MNGHSLTSQGMLGNHVQWRGNSGGCDTSERGKVVVVQGEGAVWIGPSEDLSTNKGCGTAEPHGTPGSDNGYLGNVIRDE